MRRKTMAWLAVGVVGAVVGLTTGLARAADHTDPPDRASDSAADIADLYAWHGDGTLTTVVTFAGLTMPGDPATYDEDVLYGIHIDTNDDQQSDHDIWIRFGQNGDGEMGVQVSGVPGEDAPLVGPVETTLESDTGTKAYAGLRDDPFFFDLEGFMSTLDTGSLQFDSNRDSFAGTNVTAVVVELPLEAISSDSFDVWATTARINGGA